MQAVSSKNIYSEHGLEALIRPDTGLVCQRLMIVSNCRPGSPQTCVPSEIVRITAEGVEQVAPPGKDLQICAFLWVYYGYPASSYEGINVETVRNRCGAALAQNDDAEIDVVAGIPDSGIAHALGYAAEAGIPYKRPFVKYTPTWPRSFMPQVQAVRDLVARMKLLPIEELIKGKRLLFCEDSIVRGTQLCDTIQRLYDSGALEVHMRPACAAC